ncbi:MAG: DUF2332 family protein [Dehalococcoidia bacterium]|nr:DUF2332 family protein [Dehalococcoidia bacterium]
MAQEQAPNLECTAEAFRRYCETARNDNAPLYEQMAGRIREDPELLEIAAHARSDRPTAYLFFDAVQYLVLGGTDHEVARYYPSVTEDALPAAFAYPVFRDFCRKNADLLRYLVANHNNQTNEVGRMSAMLPVIGEAARRGGGKPIGIVEVGPSAGLNLIFDRYLFDYGRTVWGDMDSSVRVVCRLEDDRLPPLEKGIPNVAYRIGLDIEPIDLSSDDSARWMLSSTWADHRDLSLMQHQAIEVLRQDPPQIVQGDALQVGEVLKDVPMDLTLVVYQSFMLMYLTPEDRERFLAVLAEESRRRPVYFVSMLGAGIGGGTRRAKVDLHSWVDGRYEVQQMVEGHSHGRSIKWVAGATA